jgi:ribonuclease T2
MINSSGEIIAINDQN